MSSATTLEELRAENTKLRAMIANSKIDCVYCGLTKEDFQKCRSGFPGCDRADDMQGCPHLAESLTEFFRAEDLQKQVDGLQLSLVVEKARGEKFKSERNLANARATQLNRQFNDLKKTFRAGEFEKELHELKAKLRKPISEERPKSGQACFVQQFSKEGISSFVATYVDGDDSPLDASSESRAMWKIIPMMLASRDPVTYLFVTDIDEWEALQ